MPKPSRFLGVETSEISEIAIRIERRMRNLRLSVAQLSHKCSIISGALGEENQPALSRSRIAKILMTRGGASSGTSAARVITRSELMLLARALEVSVEWLGGTRNNEDPVVWNVLAQPERSDHLIHLLEDHEDRASEVMVWSEYLPCPFVTKEFMYAFHEIHYSEVDDLQDGKSRRRLVEFFNKMGGRRRARILKPERTFEFTSLIYESELQWIAAGKNIYGQITKSVRKRCLENLVNLLTDPSLRLNLIIVDDQKVMRLRSSFRDFETVGVIGDLFSIWNYHSGSIGWSEHPKYVNRHGKYLRQMHTYAICKDVRATADYVRSLIATI